MQVTIDIPEQTYKALEALASAEKTSVDELLLDQVRKSAGIPMTPERLADRYPLIQSQHPGSIDPARIAEFDLFDPS